jgi:hypothetical protein
VSEDTCCLPAIGGSTRNLRSVHCSKRHLVAGRRPVAQVLRREEAFISPAIKPLDYRNEDLMLRKALNAAHWQIVKARAQPKKNKTTI